MTTHCYYRIPTSPAHAPPALLLSSMRLSAHAVAHGFTSNDLRPGTWHTFPLADISACCCTHTYYTLYVTYVHCA
ncbi:hypothetical protein K504DRAFT_461551, partial [Pleomassaria siparia CBS 279.74]